MKKPEENKRGLEYLSTTNVAEKVERFKKGLPYAFTEEVAADALAYIQQLEAQVPRWISVEERLPRKNEAVLVYVKNKSRCDWMEIDILGDDGWLENADSAMHTVTHWMPLPEFPKEG